MGVLEITEFCPKCHFVEGIMGLETKEGKLTGKLVLAIGCKECGKGYWRYSSDSVWTEDNPDISGEAQPQYQMSLGI